MVNQTSLESLRLQKEINLIWQELARIAALLPRPPESLLKGDPNGKNL